MLQQYGPLWTTLIYLIDSYSQTQREAHFSPKWKTTSWFNPLCDEAEEPGSATSQQGASNPDADGLLDMLDSQLNILDDTPGSAGRSAQEVGAS